MDWLLRFFMLPLFQPIIHGEVSQAQNLVGVGKWRGYERSRNCWKGLSRQDPSLRGIMRMAAVWIVRRPRKYTVFHPLLASDFSGPQSDLAFHRGKTNSVENSGPNLLACSLVVTNSLVAAARTPARSAAKKTENWGSHCAFFAIFCAKDCSTKDTPIHRAP